MEIPEYNGSTLYHYIKIEYLYNLLQKKRFILRRVDTWMDKFECPFDALRFCVGKNTMVESMGYCKSFYGASFTKDVESDAMWRLYSPDMRSVRLEIDVNELKDSILRLKKKFHACVRNEKKALSNVQPNPQPPLGKLAVMGVGAKYKEINNATEYDSPDNTARKSDFALLSEVQYIGDRKMEDWISKLAEIMKDDGRFCEHYIDALCGLLLKRKAFRYENEVRALAYWDHPLCDSKSLPMRVNPARLIKSITLDPRLCEDEARMVTNYLATTYGVPCQSIKQSGLYRAPIKRTSVLCQNANNSYEKQNKTLFLGNGFSQALCEEGCSWGSILQADKSKIKNYTLLYETRFIKGELEGGDNELGGMNRMMDKLPRLDQIKENYKTDIKCFGDKLEKARITDIITTSYDKLLEDILKESGYSIEDTDTSEKIYGIRRCMKFTNNSTGHLLRLWKIRGSAEDEAKKKDENIYKTPPQSLEHYCRHIANLSSYIKGAYPYSTDSLQYCMGMEEECVSGTLDDVSWADLFFNSDVYIAGFGMDFSEIDVWWLLTRRARYYKISGHINNSIHYLYSKSHDAEKDDVFEALNAFYVESHGICTCSNYIDNLFKAIDELDASESGLS